MDITVKLRSFAAFAAALGAAVAAEARDFTLVDIYDTSGVGTSYVCDLAFEAGEEGDSHVVYFAWNAEGDSGDTLGDWPNVLRIGSVDAGDTGKTFALPAAAVADLAAGSGTFAARAFFATSSWDYDYLTTGTKSTANAAFLNTGLKPVGGTYVIHVDCSMDAATTQQYLFGSNGSSSSFTFCGYINGNGYWAFACNNGAGAWNMPTTLKVATGTRVVVSLDSTGSTATGMVTVVSTGDRYIKTTTDAHTKTANCGLALWGRGSNGAGTAIDKYCAATIYGCVISNGTSLVRDYRPAMKGGVAGMWDAANNKFYASAGSAALTMVGTNKTSSVLSGDTQVAASDAWCAVQTTEFVWTGAAGDGLLATAGNWKGGTAPGLADGTEILTFGEGTDSATVVGEIRAYGINFATNSAFTLSAADSSARILLGRGGLTAKNTAVSGDISFNLRVPVAFAGGPQTWNVATRTVLNLHGPISTTGFESSDFTIVSSGRVCFWADNPDMTAPLVMTGTTPAYRPWVYALHTGLGPASRPTTINGSIPLFVNNGVPITNTAPLRIAAAGSGDDLYFEYSTWQDIYFLGSVHFLNTSGSTEFRNKGRVVWYHGGITSASGSLYPRFNKTVHIMDKPISLSGTLTVDGAGAIYLYATNSWSTYNPYKKTIYCMADYVMAAEGVYKPGSANTAYYQNQTATLNLNGHNQRIMRLTRGWSGSGTQLANGYTTVTSASPASLEVASSSSDTLAACVTGAAGFHFCGTGTFGFTNKTSTTVGTLRVSSGTVNLWSGGGWTATTNVVVDGGTLHVRANVGDTAFGGEAGASACKMTITSGTLSIASGEQATVLTLHNGTSYVNPGVYGGADAGLDEAHTLSYLAGGGTIRVLRSPTAPLIMTIR